MTKSTLKSTLVAATVALSFLAAPAAYAGTAKPSRDTGVGQLIAAQGNAALRVIRIEFKSAAEKAFKASLPARKKRVSTPAAAAAGGGSIAATAPCAE
jgi:hypothetical protein